MKIRNKGKYPTILLEKLMIRPRKLIRIQRNSRVRIMEDNHTFDPRFLAGRSNLFGE